MRTSFIFKWFFFSSIIFCQGYNNHDIDFLNPDFEKGSILVKFSDEIRLDVAIDTATQRPSTSIEELNELINAYNIYSIEKLFKHRNDVNTTDYIKLSNSILTSRSLHNIYEIKYPKAFNINNIINELNLFNGVDFSEPNYYTYTANTPDDPYSNDENQWYLDAVNVKEAWNTTTGDSSIIIGVIDTGVDWDHPDLQNKIWANSYEIPDNGIDDDNNGYVDDVRGWDFVNDDNNPDDDNSHGTHVAGIAAAETNNGIGISGISWNSKIMPLKMFQSGGYGTSADLALSIEYGASNGAQILNYSGGGYGESFVVAIAIADAYAGSGSGDGSILIAAAGNDYFKVDKPFPPFPPYAPMFPGCYNYVVGVEATQQNGNMAWFSNFDPTGPIVTNDGYFWNDYNHNYEVKAPGVGIFSTFPNGGYYSLNGTSMATPVVSGAVALLKSILPTASNEVIFARLIQSSSAGVLNVNDLLLNELEPDLYFQQYAISDTSYNGDGDNRADAGEIVEIYLSVKNAGGLIDSVWTKLSFGEFEDTTTAQIINNHSYIGSISEYAENSGQFDPFVVHFDENLVNDRGVVFNYEIGYDSVTYVSDNFIITVENGVEINGSYEKLVLSDNSYYLVNSPAVIDTLVINPGVTLRFSNEMFLMIIDSISAIGKPDSMITFKGANDAGVKGIIISDNGKSNFEYCIFEDGYGQYTDPGYIVNPHRIHNSIFRFNYYKKPFDLDASMDIQNNLFVENWFSGYGEHNLIMVWGTPGVFQNNIIANNFDNASNGSAIKLYGGSGADLSNIEDNIFINNIPFSIGTSSWNGYPMGIYDLPQQYWGSENLEFIKSEILDFFEFSDRAVLEPDSIMIMPNQTTHSVVADIHINDISINKYDNNYTSQNGLGTVGVENLKFTVYFTTPIDTSFTPLVTFGVREPYTQQVVIDSSKWSLDSLSWTGYKMIGLETGDGLQTMRVTNAFDDEHFPIPIEKSRFEFQIQAAGALSVAFEAVPGIGKVDLNWPPSQTDDILGYNINRAMQISDSSFSEFFTINENLVIDSTFTDFNVVPDSVYKYNYVVIGTDFTQSDPSKDVTAVPFSAPNGDANGDLDVNILDIISIVAFMLFDDPQPFLFDAADINSDDFINVLDIIGVVDILINSDNNRDSEQFPSYASLIQVGNEIHIDTDGNVAGYQFKIVGDVATTNLQTDTPMELTSKVLNEQELLVISYTLSNNYLNNQSNKILNLGDNITDYEIIDIIVSDTRGNPVSVTLSKLDENPIPENFSLDQNYPNPFNNTTVIKYSVPENSDISLVIYDILGNQIIKTKNNNVKPGVYSFKWKGNNSNGLKVATGLYFYQLKTNNFISTKKMLLVK